MINKIAILGGGSAGFIAAIALKQKFPALSVTVIRSKVIGVIGVGEGTTGFFPSYIHGRLQIDPKEFHMVAEPTWKLGIRFLNWGPRAFFDYTFRSQMTVRFEVLPKPSGFYCKEAFDHADLSSALMSQNKVFVRSAEGTPMIGPDASYHIENEKFIQYLESVAMKRGVSIKEDLVLEVRQGDEGISGLLLESGNTEMADLYVDCSGFSSVLLGKSLGEPYLSFKKTLFCDRAVVGGWRRTEEPIKPYTTAEGMTNGWCWQIDHEHMINRGYVYSSSFISDDEAELEFRAKNPKIDKTRIVRFSTGRYQNAWVKNVVAIGNACGFVEPLEATSLAAICDEADSLASSLDQCDLNPTSTIRTQFNNRVAIRWDDIREFLGIHYKFNTSFNTPFWQECRETTELAGASELIDYYRENGPGLTHRDTLLNPLCQFGLEGYWTMLIGQQVPCQNQYVPSLTERYHWHQIQQLLKAKASRGLDTAQMLSAIRSPEFLWPTRLYTQETFQTPI